MRAFTLYEEARAQGRLWSPRLLNPNVFYDASQLETLKFSSAGAINSWADRMGKGPNLTPIASGVPTWGKLGSAGAVQYLGTGGLQTTSGNSALVIAAPFTVFTLFRIDSLASTRPLYMLGSSSALLECLKIRFNISGSPLHLDNGTNRALGSNLAISTNYSLLETHDTAAVRCRYKLNGASSTNWGSDDGGTISSTTGRLSLGWDPESSIAAIGAIACFMLLAGIIDELNSRRVEGWAFWKWGIASSLPAKHMFRNSPPLIG